MSEWILIFFILGIDFGFLLGGLFAIFIGNWLDKKLEGEKEDEEVF